LIRPPDDPEALYLALDQGGHASRALVFDAHGQVHARALRDVEVFHPRPDWVEQDPEELVNSLNEVIFEVRRELGPRAAHLASAALATQRSSIVCWDRISGEALSPVLSWQDVRAHAWLERFTPEAARIHRATGLRLSAHYGASKLRWCLDHLPRVTEAAMAQRLACGPLAAFLVFRLTETRSLLVDPANAGRTLLFNLETLKWDEGLLHLFDIPASVLPEAVPTRFNYGPLVAAPRVPLMLVTGDQSAALFSAGAPQPSTAYLNMGTGAFVQRSAGHYPGDHPRLLTGIVLHDSDESVYVLEGTVNGAGSALAWAAETLRLPELVDELPGWLVRTDAEPPLFLNGISGLGAPFWVADFESEFIGGGEPWQKAVAVAESIVFLLQANLDEFQRLASPLEQIAASGGLTHVDALCQRLSDLSGLPLYRPVEHEATARGLAWLLAGKPHDWPEHEIGQWFKPQPNPALRARYARWREEMEQALPRR
jgi:glycerol kinase